MGGATTPPIGGTANGDADGQGPWPLGEPLGGSLGHAGKAAAFAGAQQETKNAQLQCVLRDGVQGAGNRPEPDQSVMPSRVPTASMMRPARKNITA